MTDPRRDIELRNIESRVAGEQTPDGMGVTIWVGEAPAGSFERLRDVWRCIAAADQEAWPSDEEWRSQLPEWVLKAFEEAAAAGREDAWDLGSWLDALGERSWIWWSSDCLVDGGGWLVRVALSEWPCGAIGALEWLALLAADFEPVEVRWEIGVMIVRPKRDDAI
jgi:hypothetical protein